MQILIRYKKKYPIRLFISRFIPVSVRVFAVDTLKNCKPVGCQRLFLNFIYDIGMHQVCFAGNRPKKTAENKFIDLKSVKWFNDHLEILQVVRPQKPPLEVVSGPRKAVSQENVKPANKQ
jgi:hypothetical protein